MTGWLLLALLWLALLGALAYALRPRAGRHRATGYSRHFDAE